MYRLLLVDDEAIIIRGIRSFVDFDALSISEVYEASNGEAALALFKEHEPDLILADINMPKMNGLDFSIAVKEIKPDTKIALITGYDYFDYALTALKAGVDDYVLKPVSKTDIQQILQKLIAKRQQDDKHLAVTKIVEDLTKKVDTVDDTGYQEKIQKEIDDHMNDVDFSLTYLAKQLSLSTSYLSNLFKRLYGQTFQEYMLTTRLERAKILLLSTNMKVYEIASAVGFDDPNYLSSSFKKKYKMSPNQFRDKVKE